MISKALNGTKVKKKQDRLISFSDLLEMNINWGLHIKKHLK